MNNLSKDVERTYNFILSEVPKEYSVKFYPNIYSVIEDNNLDGYFFANIYCDKYISARLEMLMNEQENKWEFKLAFTSCHGPNNTSSVERMLAFYTEMLRLTKQLELMFSK